MSVAHARDQLSEPAVSARMSTAFSAICESVAFWMLVATLAWAPFPLGSNRQWSWSLLTALVAVTWIVWVLSVWSAPQKLRPLWRLLVPLALSFLTLAWALIQTSTLVPSAWVHPVWQLGADLLQQPVQGSISMDRWRTLTEAMKLATYVAAGLLAFMMAQRSEPAQRLMDAIMIIGAFYAVYALGLSLAGLVQQNIFYSTPPPGAGSAGPFVSHNNFATYAGLSALCASVRIFDLGGSTLIVGRGARQFAVSAIYFFFGLGALPGACFLLSFAMLMATGSRAGSMACLVGILVLMALGGVIAGQRLTRAWATLCVLAVGAVMLGLFFLTGDNLQTRIDALVEAGSFDQTRLMLWQSALRMIGDAPLLGLGLGTFEPAYPMYADRALPFIMDKVHNDYLEFAAGLGLPAAIAWWAAIAWLTALAIRGVFVRRRNRHFSLLTVAATALVAFHSFFDFSLQIPAIALTYAVILALGVAQSAPTRHAGFE